MLTELETKLLGILMIIIMFGMGSSLTFKDFAIAFRKPHAILVGMLCQYGLMPFIAFSLAVLLRLPPEYVVGLVLIGCMPGGTTSNIFTYFSKGRLSLSILMTVCSTLMAIVAVPLTLGLYSRGLEGDWGIPPSEITKLLFVLLVPTLLGIALRKFNANAGAVMELVGSVFGVLVIVFLLASWIPRNWALLMSTGGSVYFVAIALGLFGFAFGYLLSRLMRIDSIRARTISMETGIQNGPLAILIVSMTFLDERQALVLLIPILYSIFIVLTSTAITFYYRWLTLREEQARDRAKIGLIGAGA